MTTKDVGGASPPPPTGHSRFGASGADRWIECPGSVKAQEGKPDATTIYAAEGTAGHGIAALCLEGDHDAVEFTDRVFQVEGHDIDFDEELADAVQVYIDAIRKDTLERGGKLIIERRFHLDWLDKEFFGTADCARLGKDSVLSVYDLKLGKGKTVEVEANRQLCYYALGVLGTLPKTLNVEEIEIVLVQPRQIHKDGPVRRWRCKPTDLLGYCQDLVDAAKLARGDNPPFKAGDHCTFCRAAGDCPTLKAKVFEVAQADFNDEWGEPGMVNDPQTLDINGLIAVLNAADMIEGWLKAVRTRAEELANKGVKIPGYKLVDKRALRKWRGDDEKTKSALLFDFGLDELSILSHKLKSPAQIEKLLPKANRASLASLYAKESSGTRLARVDDARDERPPARDAQADFADDIEW
jgi:Protein of unknown function (DUF2800)